VEFDRIDNKFYTEEERNKKIKKEIRKLKKLVRDLDEDKKQLCQTLIENIAYTSVQLEELKEMIKRDGYFDYYQNGENQWGTKQSVASGLYLNVGKLYSTYLKQFREILPESIGGNDEIMAFVEKHSKIN